MQLTLCRQDGTALDAAGTRPIRPDASDRFGSGELGDAVDGDPAGAGCLDRSTTGRPVVRTLTATITFGVVRLAVVGTTATRLPLT